MPYLSIVPIAESRSSYSGLLVFLFMLLSGPPPPSSSIAFRLQSVERGPAWDSGCADPRPETQYTASSFAQPIHHVFGTLVFRAPRAGRDAAAGDMPAGTHRCGALSDRRVGCAVRAPRPRRRSHRRPGSTTCIYLPIRRYLSFVFAAWSAFCWCSRYGP